MNKKITIQTILRKDGDNYTYEAKFSDNIFLMQFTSHNISECNVISAELDRRISAFFAKKTSILKISDLNFKYIKGGEIA